MMEETHIHWMSQALAQADLAAASGEVPIGAVIVRDGVLIAAGSNRTIFDCDPTAHAEIVAIRAASKVLMNYRLVGCDLYVTLEPCIMCCGAIFQARIQRLIFAASDPRWGAVHSRLQLGEPGLANHTVEIVHGILAYPCQERLQHFFRERRGANGVGDG